MRVWGTLSLVLGLTAPSARAEIIFFNYTGRSGNGLGGVVSGGSGSFSFADSPTSVGLADLTTFSFSQTTVILGIGGPVSSTFNYGRGDLTAFSATLAPNGVPTGLSLTTRAVSGSNPGFAPESFAVTSLLTDGAGTFDASGTRLTGGTVAAVVAPAVPEPSALILTATGCAAGLAYAWRHRRHLAVA